MESTTNVAVENESAVTAEEQVAVAPEESLEEGSNESVVAEQTSEDVAQPQDSSTNRAFQQMRKANEEMQRELEALKAEKQAREETFNRLVGADASDISVIAEASGLTEDEVRAEFAQSQANYEKERELESMREQLEDYAVRERMNEDLLTLRQIDPSIKSLDELGDEFMNYMATGLLTAKQAYWAVKGEESAHRSQPPKEIGIVNTTPAEKTKLSMAEIKAMSPEDRAKNYKLILNSF